MKSNEHLAYSNHQQIRLFEIELEEINNNDGWYFKSPEDQDKMIEHHKSEIARLKGGKS